MFAVIARSGATKQSIHRRWGMDRFAALAMTNGERWEAA
jgi:hypothetical protein